MKYMNRIVGNLVFITAFVLSGWLAFQFHGTENIVALGVAGLALVLSAFGLVFARNSWSENAKAEFFLGCFLWIAGASAFTITELGFWFSSYNERHAEYEQIKKAKTRTEGMKDQAWAALTTGQVPLTTAQLEADLNAKKFDPIWERSKQCTDATLPDSRAFCAEIFAHKSQLAAARKRESLELQFQSTAVDKPSTSYVHDVFAQAEMLANLLGIDEKQAATIVILSTWLLLMLARDTGLLVANPVGRRREDAPQPEETTPEPTNVPAVIEAKADEAKPAQVELEPQMKGLLNYLTPEQIKAMMEHELPAGPLLGKPQDPAPEPDDDGSARAEKTEPEDTEQAPEVNEQEPTTVVNFPNSKPKSKRELAKLKKERLERENMDLVEAFVTERLDTEAPGAQIELTDKGGWKSGGTVGDDIYQEFKRFCRQRTVTAMGRNHLGRLIGAFVNRAKNSKGTMYGAVIRNEQRKRKAA